MSYLLACPFNKTSPETEVIVDDLKEAWKIHTMSDCTRKSDQKLTIPVKLSQDRSPMPKNQGHDKKKGDSMNGNNNECKIFRRSWHELTGGPQSGQSGGQGDQISWCLT